LPPCYTTACNGLKGLHSNNRETNCRALARYRAWPVGRPRLAARDQHQRSYITVAFVTATCLCFRLVFAIPLHRSLLEPSTDSETSLVSVLSRDTSRTSFETKLITHRSRGLVRNESISTAVISFFVREYHIYAFYAVPLLADRSRVTTINTWKAAPRVRPFGIRIGYYFAFCSRMRWAAGWFARFEMSAV